MGYAKRFWNRILDIVIMMERRLGKAFASFAVGCWLVSEMIIVTVVPLLFGDHPVSFVLAAVCFYAFTHVTLIAVGDADRKRDEQEQALWLAKVEEEHRRINAEAASRQKRVVSYYYQPPSFPGGSGTDYIGY